MDRITFGGPERSKGKLLRSVLRRGGSSDAASLSGGRMVRVRGDKKVMAHLMFGMIALIVDQLMRFVT